MPIEIIAEFEGGRLGRWRADGDTIHLHPGPEAGDEHLGDWFYFLVMGAKDRELTFIVDGVDLAAAPVAVSYDRFAWIPPDERVGKTGFRHRFLRDDAVISLTPPYTPGMLYEFTLWARRSPHARIEYLDQVYGVTGITISEMEQTEGKPSIWVTAGAFPLGAAASWVAEGLVRFLLSQDPAARALRRDFTFRIFPVPEPYGVQGQEGGGLSKGRAALARALTAEAAAGRPIAALVSIQGRTYGPAGTIRAGGAGWDGAAARSVARHAPWYTLAGEPAPGDWFLQLDAPAESLRLQIETGWFYPEGLLAGGLVQRSQFDLIQEGELLCRALAPLAGVDLGSEASALPPLLGPRLIRRAAGGAAVRVWLPPEEGGEGRNGLHVAVVGEGFMQPMDPAPAEEQAGTFRLFTAELPPGLEERAQAIAVERPGARRLVPLAERESRPSDMSLA